MAQIRCENPLPPTAIVVGYASACEQLKVNIASRGEGN